MENQIKFIELLFLDLLKKRKETPSEQKERSKGLVQRKLYEQKPRQMRLEKKNHVASARIAEP